MNTRKSYSFIAFICFNIFIINALSAQTPKALIDSSATFLVDENKDTIYIKPENAPQFPDGQRAMYLFLGQNIRYPSLPRESGAQGIAYIEFVVNADGKIVDVKSLSFTKLFSTNKRDAKKEAKIPKSVYDELTNEAIRVVKLMPNWKPGTIKNEPVRVRYSLPLKFRLE
jgi:periplasmic protein TonB